MAEPSTTPRLPRSLLPSLLLSLVLLVSPWPCGSPPSALALTRQRGVRVKELTDKSFEHDTQAATGQTTGRWLVIFVGDELDSDEFVSPDSSSVGVEQSQGKDGGIEGGGEAEGEKEKEKSGPMVSEAILQAVMHIASEQVPREFIPARVDVRENPGLKTRFGINSTPTVKLFRDRKVFSFPGIPATRAQLEAFLQDPSSVAAAEEVPPEPSPLDQLLKEAQLRYAAVKQRMSEEPLLLILAGIVVMATTSFLTSLFLKPEVLKGKVSKTKPAADVKEKKHD